MASDLLKATKKGRHEKSNILNKFNKRKRQLHLVELAFKYDSMEKAFKNVSAQGIVLKISSWGTHWTMSCSDQDITGGPSAKTSAEP